MTFFVNIASPRILKYHQGNLKNADHYKYLYIPQTEHQMIGSNSLIGMQYVPDTVRFISSAPHTLDLLLHYTVHLLFQQMLQLADQLELQPATPVLVVAPSEN